MLRKLIPDVVSGQRLLKMPLDSSVRDAVRAMARHDVRSVLVVDGEILVGIFTGTDLISRVVAPSLDPDTTTLDQVMTRNPQTIDPDENAIEALRRMQFGRFRHLPIVCKGALMGVISRRDFYGCEIDAIEGQERIWERA